MSDLPDRYGKAENEEGKVVTDNFVTWISLCICACHIAIIFTVYNVRGSDFYPFGSFMLEALNFPPLLMIGGLASILLGVGGTVVAVCLGWAALFNNKKAMKYILILSALLSVCELAIGAYVQSNLDTVYLAATTGGIGAPQLGSLTSRISHFQFAMFNGCCASQGNTKERFTPADTIGDNSVLPSDYDYSGYVKHVSEISAKNKQNNENKMNLRSSYAFQETYRQYNLTVANNLEFICTTMTSATANIEGLNFPGTSLRVSPYVGGKTVIPVVGYYEAPTFGCGNGYAKAFQAAQFLWLMQNLKPLATTLIGAGVVGVLFVLLAFSSSCSRSNSGSAEQEYDKYIAQVAASQGQGSAPREQSAGQHMSMRGGPPMAMEVFEHVNPSNRQSMQSAYSQSQAGFHDSRVVSAAYNVDDKI